MGRIKRVASHPSCIVWAVVAAASFCGCPQPRPQLDLVSTNAQIRMARAQVNLYCDAIMLYHKDCPDKFISNLSELFENSGCPHWRGPYIQNAALKDGLLDPFGNALRFVFNPDIVRVISLGPDLILNTTDDIIGVVAHKEAHKDRLNAEHVLHPEQNAPQASTTIP